MSCRGYHCARARRSARRQQLQAEYQLNKELKAALNGEHNNGQHINGERIQEEPVLSLNRQPMNRVTKALSVRRTYTVDSAGSCCLTNTSLYSARRYPSKPKSGYGVTAKV
ncbi:hypothetical protein ACXHVK_001132 [Morganella morganii]|uniref:hypothetical protein n=1 Tax=Morganella morganii TaxID=582 RepID=UPI0006A49BD8|nr:hypothetical protein [Morganella morganii]EKK5376677.1 hypothetical protein [Morganella morganii]KNZ87194.1 hypothetical protein AKG16_11295 [Morganella morganii]MBS9540547.1 hypothetical protein [Morganella morganii subsp. morganii]MDF2405581.1 hypothetical protein [Morganella morganii]HCR4032738.1 hypothetical protein [Morganella morganii]